MVKFHCIRMMRIIYLVIGLVSVPKPVLAIIGLNRTICPHSSQWSLRSRSLCNESKPEYLCLFDDNEKVFKEFCQKDSETQRPGYEFVIRGELDDKECIDDRYQPIKLTTDGNSQCMFQKSKCSGEGQLNYNIGTTISDRLCRCDYTNSYIFVKKSGDNCVCDPSKEDCSCYKMTCSDQLVLSPDYQCIELKKFPGNKQCQEIKRPEMDGDVSNEEKGDVITSHLENFRPNHKPEERLVYPIHILIVTFVFVGLILLGGAFYWEGNRTAKYDIATKMQTGNGTAKDDEDTKIQIDTTPQISDALQSFELMDNIKELRQDLINDWQKEEDHIHVTIAMQSVTDMLKEYSCVTVIGPPASGKSSIIHHVALQWQEDGYELIPIISKQYRHKPLEILKSNNSESRKIFVVDDFCGVDNVDVVAVDAWKSHFKELIALLINNDAVKILITCRKSIFERKQLDSLTFMTVYTYKMDENPSSPEEKRSILEKYIKKENAPKVYDLIDKYTKYFPLLCKIAARRQVDKQEESFNIQSIEQDISNMPDEDFISLFVCILFDEFSNDWIERENRPERVDKAIQCLLQKCTHLDIKKALQQLPINTGTYVKQTKNGYSLVHKFINDIVFLKCEERAEGIFIQYASPCIIATRFRFISIKQNSESNMEVAISKKKQYFERLKRDLKNEDLDSTFHNNQLIYQTYRRKLLHYIKHDNEMKTILKNIKTKRKPLIELVMEGHNDLIQMLIGIRGCKEVNETDIGGRSALHIAAEMGYTKVAQTLIENGAEDFKDNNNRTPLDIAQANGHNSIVTMLIKNSRKK